MNTITYGKFDTKNVAPITTDLDGWQPVEGSPSMKTWIEYAAENGKLLSGFWEAQPGTYAVTYNADEVVHIFEGEAVLTDKDGQSVTYKAGDSFVVKAGFSGTWKTIKTIRKFFTIDLPEDVTAPFGG